MVDLSLDSKVLRVNGYRERPVHDFSVTRMEGRLAGAGTVTQEGFESTMEGA